MRPTRTMIQKRLHSSLFWVARGCVHPVHNTSKTQRVETGETLLRPIARK